MISSENFIKDIMERIHAKFGAFVQQMSILVTLEDRPSTFRATEDEEEEKEEEQEQEREEEEEKKKKKNNNNNKNIFAFCLD